MSAEWTEALLQPLAGDQPCGQSLEDSALLASFDALRLFGQARSIDDPPAPDENRKAPKWVEIRADSLDALGKSKDLRLLAHFGVAVLRTDGLLAFFDTLAVASHWLESYWPHVYPLIDEDAVARQNALNCFADPMAVIKRLRRTPLVESRQHGRFSLQDIEIANGEMPPVPSEAKPEQAPIDAAFSEMPVVQLAGLAKGVAAAKAALDAIDAKMRDVGGPEVAPSFEQLSSQMVKLTRALSAQLALRPSETPDEAGSTGAAGSGSGDGAVVAVSGIKSRADAIRALDAVTEYFRRNEPSSPIPLFLDRAKRLVSKDFFEVLADIAPDAIGAARAAGGVKN